MQEPLDGLAAAAEVQAPCSVPLEDAVILYGLPNLTFWGASETPKQLQGLSDAFHKVTGKLLHPQCKLRQDRGAYLARPLLSRTQISRSWKEQHRWTVYHHSR